MNEQVVEIPELISSGRQRSLLHAFLVSSVGTIARPGAVVDINAAPDRQQWWPCPAPTLDLNPQGRTQNKKHRALLPVLPLLDRWLAARGIRDVHGAQACRAQAAVG